VVTLALAVIDDEGADALTLAKVAERAGVAPPSLYKHVQGLPALRRLADLRVLTEMTEAIRGAVLGRSGAEAVAALLDAYRGYLRRHPHRATALETPLASADEELANALHGTAEAAFAALRPYDFDQDQTVHATRVLRAAVHGFASLEAAGGFGLPQDLDASFEVLKSMLIQGLSTLSRK
jgi:AcrR family transcriptional regulator